MDIQEIRRYIEVGSGYIEVDRSYPEKYQGPMQENIYP